MVAFNHKSIGSNASPLIKNVGKCTNLHNRSRCWWSCKTSGISSPTTPLLLRATGRCTTNWGLPVTLMTLHHRVWVRLISNRAPTRLCHRMLLHIKSKTRLCSNPATSHKDFRLRQAKGKLMNNLTANILLEKYNSNICITQAFVMSLPTTLLQVWEKMLYLPIPTFLVQKYGRKIWHH